MVSLLVEIDASRRTLLARATDGSLPLHSAVRYQAPEAVVVTLLGGDEGRCALLEPDAHSQLPLHAACMDWSAAGRDRRAPQARRGHVDGDAGIADKIEVLSPPPLFAVFFFASQLPVHLALLHGTEHRLGAVWSLLRGMFHGRMESRGLDL